MAGQSTWTYQTSNGTFAYTISSPARITYTTTSPTNKPNVKQTAAQEREQRER